MKQQTAPTDHSGAIWALGILLVIAVAATSPYWQMVGKAVAAGDLSGVESSGGTDASGLWMTLGALLVVAILAGMAQISEGAGGFALVLLLGLWMLFLLGHVQGVQGFFQRFQPAAAQPQK